MQRYIDLSLIQPSLEAAITSIKDIRTDNLQEVYDSIQNSLKEYNIRVTDADKQHFREQVQHKYMYIDTVIDQLQQWLMDSKQLSAFTLFDPQKVLPQTGKGEAFQQWGSSQVAILEHACELEAYALVYIPQLNNARQLKLLVSNETLESTYMYLQLSKLASICLVIPVSTAECEQCFSAMKHIKTNLQNRLLTSTLRNSMRISIEAPPLEDYDLDQAVKIWSGMRQRRITT